ncbi:MAG: hypothetical protein KatS3mg050_4506 [Litorilinea sp.]|nr:MAG: hypothetical protein KatS3mg050_4506 [Litorilinea sp.]
MTVQTTGEATILAEERSPWLWTAARWLEARLRPHLGWVVLLVCMLLSLLPAMAMRVNRWVDLNSFQAVVDWMGPLGVAGTWLVLGWRRPGPGETGPRRALAAAVGLMLLGPFLLSQFLVGWLPGPLALWRAAQTGAWSSLLAEMAGDWLRLLSRYGTWWQGVQAGGAAQDDLVFAGVAGLVLWTVGVLTAWLVRRYRQGLLAAAPSLWLLGTILLYSSGGRSLLVTGLALAALLHLLLDFHTLLRRWEALALDFNPGLLWDRLAAAAAAVFLVLFVAAVMPNLYIGPIAYRYFDFIAPYNQRLEEMARRLFPDVKGTSRLPGGQLAGGLPNEFLLAGGPDLSATEIMRVRTNDAVYSDYPFEDVAPPGHYMRSGTFAVYDGKGWQNPSDLTTLDQSADDRWGGISLEGRKLLVQTVFLSINSSVLYAAPEPIEASVDYRLLYRQPDDLVALRARESSYTVVSAIPAVNEEMLRAVPDWGETNPVPEELAVHLQLPDTVTPRTRELAQELTAGLDGPFAKAQAIEQYLRTFTYDLTVPPPPADVEDVADYFLFDLQRGYCDYYATAFVVLARLAGLPTRFATGFAVGHWDPYEQIWIVTEAEAHSWPEVYMPPYGWIPFEPTAGRPELSRVAAPGFSGGLASNPGPSTPTEVDLTPEESAWSWQLLFWLVPLGLLLWGVWAWLARWRAGREDPWTELLRHGRRLGRPMEAGETVLEYGRELAAHITTHQARTPDTGRIVAREILALSRAVSDMLYGAAARREQAMRQASEHWGRLRGYLRGLRVRA